MFSYLQMPFLQALGYAIANSIWQMFLLWLIVLLVNSIAKQSSHIKHVTALSAQVAGFVWFLTTFQFYYRHCLAASEQAERLAGGNEIVYLQNMPAGSGSVLSFLVRTEETLPYLSLTYLLFLFYLIVKWVQSFRYTKVLSAKGLTAIDGHWQAFVNEMADRLNIMQDVRIYLSSVAASPMTIGYIKPVILLPFASLNHLTTEQLEAVILHELAHIKRADYIINLIVSLAEMIMFFNPFTRLLSNAIQKERENCCDDWVLQYQYNAGMYAEALLRIACLQKEGFEMTAAVQQKGELLQRVKRMVQPSRKKFSYRYQATAMMFIAALLFCIAWLQPSENDYPKTAVVNKQAEDKKVMIAPVMAQVENPFFNGASLFTSSLHDEVLQSLSELDETMTDSAVTGIKEAQKALAESVPDVVTTLSSGNWHRLVQEAIENAGASFQNPDVTVAYPDRPQLLFDSAAFLEKVQNVLSATSQWHQAQADIDAAKMQLQYLKSDKAFNYSFSFSTDYLNGLCTDALASLQNLNLPTIRDSVMAVTDKFKRVTVERNRKSQEKIEKQAQALQQLQLRRSQILAMTANKRSRVLPPMPPQEIMGVDEDAVPTVSADDNDNSDAPGGDTQPVNYSWSVGEPAGYYGVSSPKKVTKTIHITNGTGNGSYNIVIEIRQ